MGMVAILVMWLDHLIKLSFSQGGSKWNLILIGPVVSQKTFEECGPRRTTEDCLSYKLTNEPSTQVS